MKHIFRNLFGSIACTIGALGATSLATAAEPPVPKLADYQDSGELICAWKEGAAKEVIRACEKLGFTIKNGSYASHWVVCSWKNGLKEETLAELKKHPGVRFVEPNVSRSLPSVSTDDAFGPKLGAANGVTPKDPLFDQLYGMKNIGANLAWRVGQSTPIIVAVVDTGVDYTHEDLKDNMWRNPKPGAKDVHGADFINTNFELDRESGKNKLIPGNDPMDEHYHGTHVAGTIGALGDNGLGVTGVAWKVQIMAVRCLGANGNSKADSIANAIRYAADNGARVINLSVGGRFFSQAEAEAVEYAGSKGAILVCAAGNKKDKDPELDNDKVPEYPASHKSSHIVTVANIDVKEALNPGSHFGKSTVHIAGPGTNILSTIPMIKTAQMKAEEKQFNFSFSSKYSLLTGTSMAAPHVSGAIALVMAHPKFQGKSPREVADVVLKNARKISSATGKTTTEGTLDISFLGKLDNVLKPIDPKDPVVIKPVDPIKPIDPIKPVTPYDPVIKTLVKPIDPKDCEKDCPIPPKGTTPLPAKK